MKRILFFLLITSGLENIAKYQIVTIKNSTSDLKFDHAYKVVNNVKKNLLALTKRLQQSSENNKKHVVIEHTVCSEGFGISMKDDIGNPIQLIADGQVRSDIEMGRKKSKRIANFPISCNEGTQPYCARALMQDKDQKIIASACYGYQQQGDLVNLNISGSYPSYKLSYEKAY